MTPSIAFKPQSEPVNFLARSPVAFPAGHRAGRFVDCVEPHVATPITATILTKNSESLLADVLRALEWCDEIVVLDTGSTDRTLLIAAEFANVRFHVLDGPFPGFGRAHRRAVELARNDWIFSVDSDEIVTPGLAAEIAALRLDVRTVYTIPFQNFYRARHITTCGWSPDRHERLFNRTATNFCLSEVHERVQSGALMVVPLRHAIAHDMLMFVYALPMTGVASAGR